MASLLTITEFAIFCHTIPILVNDISSMLSAFCRIWFFFKSEHKQAYWKHICEHMLHKIDYGTWGIYCYPYIDSFYH